MKKSIPGILSVLCLLMLLFHPQLALEGARQGLLLWGNIVLPTLLPFMICSGVIVAMDGIHILTGPFQLILSGFLRLSEKGSYVFMSGLLCGYPMGAKNVSDFLDSGCISPEEGAYLLAISNHPSPMFLLGYMMSQISQIPGSGTFCSLWAVASSLYLPVIPISVLARHYYHYTKKKGSFSEHQGSAESSFSFDNHMMSSFETMVKIGGYIMLFSILATYLRVFPLPLPPLVLPALLGAVEITTGIQSIAQSVSGQTGALMMIGAAAFGGLSGIFQTKSVLKNAGLSIRHYVAWKLLHSFLSCLFFYGIICLQT